MDYTTNHAEQLLSLCTQQRALCRSQKRFQHSYVAMLTKRWHTRCQPTSIQDHQRDKKYGGKVGIPLILAIYPVEWRLLSLIWLTMLFAPTFFLDTVESKLRSLIFQALLN